MQKTRQSLQEFRLLQHQISTHVFFIQKVSFKPDKPLEQQQSLSNWITIATKNEF